jgi:hypothetical protein
MNPTLARNAIHLALRRATEARLGGRAASEAVGYHQTAYSLALLEFSGPNGCSGGIYNRAIEALFPNWTFEIRASLEQKKSAAFEGCRQEHFPAAGGARPAPPAMGAGAAVRLAEDFYVTLPSPLALSTGTLEVPDSLRIALADRDKIQQAMVDRGIGQVVARETDETGAKLSVAERRDLAFALLNEGWNYVRRP